MKKDIVDLISLASNRTLRVSQATAKGYIECCEGGSFDAAYPNSTLRRARVQLGGSLRCYNVQSLLVDLENI